MYCGHCGNRIPEACDYCVACGGPAPAPASNTPEETNPPLARCVLTSVPGGVSFEVPWNRTVRVGRSRSADISIMDPSISRLHAELVRTEDGCVVRDLGSSNGTYVNAIGISQLTLRDGDTLHFGTVRFVVRIGVVRMGAREPVRIGEIAVSASHDSSNPADPRLRDLVRIAKDLARREPTDRILERIVEAVLNGTSADRASIATCDRATGDLTTGVHRVRGGTQDGTRHFPHSIAHHCMQERVAILTESAGRDERFHGNSIVTLGVCSAMCAPLLAADEGVLGICYVDHVRNTAPFLYDDLDFLIAASGIAAAALERQA